MKKFLLTQFMLLLFASVFFMACSDEDSGETILLPKLDGLFAYGKNALAETPTEPASKMSLAQLDPTKGAANKDRVYGKYMYIGASGELQFAEVISEVGKIYGSADAAIVNGADEGFSVNDNIITGTLVEGGAAIAVADEGLYYVFADMNAKTFVITKVKGQMIGDAIKPLGWDAGTVLPLKSTTKEKTMFEGTNIQMTTGGGYKYRFNDGWHSYTDANMSTHSFLGVVDYDAAWVAQHADVGFFTSNIPSFHAGYYTVNLTYTESTTGGIGVWTETLTKTGEVLVNYTDYSVAIIGDATAGGSFNGDGTGGYQSKKPTKAGNIYTWTWDNVSLIQDKDFIFLQDAKWGGLQIDYAGAAVSGSTITDGKVIDATAPPVSGQYHNFHVITAGSYDITLTIDAATEGRTVKINNN